MSGDIRGSRARGRPPVQQAADSGFYNTCSVEDRMQGEDFISCVQDYDLSAQEAT